MMQSLPQTRDLCLIGGGHAHALLLRMWAMDPLPGVRITLINPGPVAAYTGMLPGFVAGHYRRDEIMVDLVRLARLAGARLVIDRVTGIDPVGQVVHLAGRGAIAYDLASINVGITSDLPDLPGFAEHGFAAKPLGAFADRWENFADANHAAPQVGIIGGGVGGVELALAVRHRLGPEAGITLLEQGAMITPLLGARARGRLIHELGKAGVQVRLNLAPVGLDARTIRLSDGTEVASDFTLSVAGGRAPAWLAQTGLETKAGYISVNEYLQTSVKTIFAVGDCAALPDPRPKAGVYAVRQAPILLHNLQSALAGYWGLKPYRPQRDYLKLISLGGQSALAEKRGFALQGPRLWTWKDRIDRRFMQKLASFPAMNPPALPDVAAEGMAEALGEKPSCGGCGAKVGAEALRAGIASLPSLSRSDILAGPGDDAAVLSIGGALQVITTDHLRSVSADPGLMARIAAIHALGDVWAMGAAPQGALAQIILPRLSPALQARTLTEIMAAASAVFAQAGAEILGGHTSIGEEMTIGFTVTGLAQRIIAKSGAQAGDALVLSKPLGIGTILAAEMAAFQPSGLVLGETVAQAFASMTRPMIRDAATLAPLAHAMTDVTGFGLAGHLIEMLRASNLGAQITLADIPLLPGAEALAAQGIASTLAPENRAAFGWEIDMPESPRAALLFDPQTCGGLLAAIPANAVAQLPDGFAVIGRVTETPVRLRVL